MTRFLNNMLFHIRLGIFGLPIDPRTGRAVGDHGTAQDAIDFCLAHCRTMEPEVFLRAWREGCMDEWPEYYVWLAKREEARR